MTDAPLPAEPSRSSLVGPVLLLNFLLAVGAIVLTLTLDRRQAPPQVPVDVATVETVSRQIEPLAGAVDALKGRTEHTEGTLSRLDRDQEALSSLVRSGEAYRPLAEQVEQMEKTLASIAERVVVLEDRWTDLEQQTPAQDPNEPARTLAAIQQDILALSRALQALDAEYRGHVHTVELRDLKEGWNHAYPGWASDFEGLRHDTSERRLTPPIPPEDGRATWSENGLGGGTTQLKNR